MLTSHMRKRSATDSSDLLSDLGILQNVLGYVGLGHHLFVALVSKLWKEVYSTLKSQQLTAARRSRKRRISQTTWFSSVFASPSRVEFALESGLGCTAKAYQRTAGRFADIAALATAHKLGMEYTATTMTVAAQCNKLAEVQYLHNQGCPWSSSLLEKAARDGHFELLRWCYEHGCPFLDPIARAPAYAAQSGNVELMAWVLQLPGAQLSEAVMKAAVSHGYTDMCKYLHEQQCPWDASATQQAAVDGHIDLLRWLLDNGCPWHADKLCMAGADSGSIELMSYLQQQGLLTSAELLTEMLESAGCYNNLAAAKWLREQGAEWPTEFDVFVWSGEVLEWARAEGCTTPVD
jgi:hypothetical protein